jgi:hypothetical protein
MKEAKKGINMYANRRSVMHQTSVKNEKERRENEVERRERTGRSGKEERKEDQKKDRNCYHWLGFEEWSFRQYP